MGGATIEQSVIDAFRAMYDHYPESVMLIHKSREIIAVNPAGASIGREPGMRCSQLQPLISHAGCMADEAIRTGKATWRKKRGPNGDVISFWLPVDGYPDCLIHFSVGSIQRYDYTV